MTSIHKALTFRASSIGDCLMGAYLLNNIHIRYPNARLGLVVGSKAAMIRDLLAGYPYIEVVEVNRRHPKTLWRLWRTWRGSDLVVTQYAGKPGGRFSLASKLVARFLATRGGLVGFMDGAPRLNKVLYDRLVRFDTTAAPAEMERQALHAAGQGVPLLYPTLTTSVSNDTLTRFGLVARGYVLVHLFSGSSKRGLSPAKRRELVTTLYKILPPDVVLVLSGSRSERSEAQVAAGNEARTIAGEATLQEMIQLVAAARVVVSLDTGLAHIAAQLRAPLVVLASCLGLHWWGKDQYGPDIPAHLFCNQCTTHVMDNYPPCINEVSVQEVAAQMRLLTNSIT